MPFLLLAAWALATQTELPEGVQERLRIESAAGYSLVQLDELVLYYGPGKKADVGLQSTVDRSLTFLTVMIDDKEVVRLRVLDFEKPLALPPAELPENVVPIPLRRTEEKKPFVRVEYRPDAGPAVALYDGPGTGIVPSTEASVGKRKACVVTVDKEVVYRAPIGAELPPPSLDGAGVASLAARFKANGPWVFQSLVLLSLGESFAPLASDMLVQALQAKDKRVRAFAVEALSRATPPTLAAVATPELLDALAAQLPEKNAYYSSRAAEVMRKVLPDAGKDLVGAWRKAKAGYAPKSWEKPPIPRGAPAGPGQTVADRLLTRAVDLSDAGLDLAICIDTTGSMQNTIDAAKAGLADIVAILRGVSPQFRLGLVHYRDVTDMPEGGELLVPLTPAVEPVQQVLATLKAGGGGDFPENVERGMALALRSPRMGWKKNTNKVVIVVGDAPPHDVDLETCLTLARTAREAPFGAKMVPTGPGPVPKDATRPFVVSTIGVAMGSTVATKTEEAFKKIAQAGGGAYGILVASPKPLIKGEPVEAGQEPDAIVEHLLTMAFGAEWTKPLGVFMAVYREYRKQGFIK